MNEVLAILRDIKERDTIEEYYTALGRFCLDDYYLYLRILLGYKFLDPWDHGEDLCGFLKENWGHPMLFLVPRGGIKTGSITIPIPGWIYAKDVTVRGSIYNAQKEKAQAYARAAADVVKGYNYQRAFPWVIPGAKWGDSGYYLDVKAATGIDSNDPTQDVDLELGGATERGDPSLGFYGVGGNITGGHLRLLLHDDLINQEMVESKNCKDWLRAAVATYKESLNTFDRGGQHIVCMTRWLYGDIGGALESGDLPSAYEKFRVFKRGATRKVKDQNGNVFIEYFNPKRTYVDMFGNVQQIGYDKDFLENMKSVFGSRYYALYYNTPIADEDRPFDITQIQEFIQFPEDYPLGGNPRICMETEGQGRGIYVSVIEHMRDQGKLFAMEHFSVTRKVDKASRIKSALQKLVDEGRLHVRQDLMIRGRRNLGDEFDEFDKGEDDALDALASCVMRASKYVPGLAARVCITVDPAITENEGSNHTAIVAGVWIHDHFWVLDCEKFKTQKPTTIGDRIFRMAEKFNRGNEHKKFGAKVRSTRFGPRGRIKAPRRGQTFDVDTGD